MFILFGKYDQLTSMTILEKYSETRNNPMIKIYNRSHSTILTDYGIYEDYAEQLDKWGN